MGQAAEKRAYIAKFAKQFGDINKAIREDPKKDNNGALLEKWLKYPSTPWRAGMPWCACFVSAMAYYTDQQFSGEPKSSYNSASSQYTGAGNYGGKNPKNAKVGLAISWTEDGGSKNGISTGHVGIVIEVLADGIMTVEGNTDNREIQERNGGETAVKKYTWAKVLKPSSKRHFNGYFKIWKENEDTLGAPLPSIGDVASTGNTSNSTDTGNQQTYKSQYEREQTTNTEREKQFIEQMKKISQGVLTNQQVAENSAKTVKEVKETKVSTDYEAKQIADSKVQMDKINVVLTDKTQKA